VANAVVTPDRIELSYAAFGEDARQEAVVALEADQKQMIFAAVAVPTANGWERIGTFDYWCKYEMYHGGNALGESVELRPAPELGLEVPAHFELVLRASGGGTGIYMQDEGHFRVYQGELRLVITFVSRERTCDPTSAGCDVERRWFYPSAFGSLAGGTLVTARGRFPSDKAPEVLWALRDLEDRFLGTATCVAYTWNAQSFQYVPSPSADPCKPRAQQGSSRQPDWEGRN
jgi:hypothetical protein